VAKLCARGKAAAKRKFDVYPSAYANMYASSVCSGKTTPGGKKKKKMANGGEVSVSQKRKKKSSKNPKALARACGMVMEGRRKRTKYS